MINIFIRLLFLILTVFTSHSSTLLANNATPYQSRVDLINELEKDLSNVGEIVDDKIYITPSSFHVSQNHIFLNFRGLFIPVANLSTDSKGLYISLEDFRAGLWGNTWICPNPDCGYENYDAVNYCGICGTRKPR